jgi:hypothetical protein
LILEQVTVRLDEYNRVGRKYNTVADAIYVQRKQVHPFSAEYGDCIVEGLVGFDMARTMGDLAQFQLRLRSKLRMIWDILDGVLDLSIEKTGLQSWFDKIEQAYDLLASPGQDGLHRDRSKHFHVGTTKILHWLAPDLFIMMDSHVSRAFQRHYQVGYRNSTQPGYTAAKYLFCLQQAQKEVNAFGCDRLFALELETPKARVFDKVSWIVGRQLRDL